MSELAGGQLNWAAGFA